MMRSRLVATGLALSLVFGFSAATADDPASVGEWLPAFSEGGLFDANPPASRAESAILPTAVSAVVLPDGRILYWNGAEGIESADLTFALQRPNPEESRSRVLDLSSYFLTGDTSGAAWTVPTPENGGGGDMFCADQRLLADGRVVVAGGSDWVNEDEDLGLPNGLGRTDINGRRNTRFFAPHGGEGHDIDVWTQGPSMNRGRWYPAVITLPDGRLLAMSGVEKLVYNSSATESPSGSPLPVNVHETEIFDPTHPELGWQTTGPSGEMRLPLFPRVHLLPDGTVYYGGMGQMWSPFGEDPEQLDWMHQRTYDPIENEWHDLGMPLVGARSSGFSVMLPLRPVPWGDYLSATVLMAGGTLGVTPSSYVGLRLSETARFDNLYGGGTASPHREIGRPMVNRRWFSSGVVLPSGEVIAFSGADRDEVMDPGTEIPVRQAEMYDPRTREWTALSSASRDRTYHNSAVLLRDGSVLVGGHAPIPAHYGASANHLGPPFANNFKDPSFQIFRPPYLYRGPRPTITEAPDAVPTQGTFSLTVPVADATNPGFHVVLSRLPATTHVTDADQRTVYLRPNHWATHGHHTTYEMAMPGANITPPGYYYLFVMRDNGRGPTPSMAEIVRVG